ncbi:MAG: ABC transporter substrate-binding protein [Alphaproteobacteria bacterium]|nr:ABC transporter substrate-binding protein [Alphaproteobacteria bacterium]
MPEHSKQSAALHRRDVLKAGSGLAASALVPAALTTTRAEAATSSTLVIAAPATPQSLDSNFDVSLGTFEAVAALYDNLLEFKKIPDPKVPGASREDIADHPNLPAGLAIQGKLAQSFELDPAGRFIRFQLRPGVKSNWGNELTADDVKWTWDRKFGLKAIGGFYLSTLGLEKPEGVKVEGKYTVSINLDHPNPLLAKLQPNLYAPIYDSKKCKEVATADDPWARKFIENNSAGFGPYRLEQLQRGQQAVFKARQDYYLGKPAMETVIFREVPTSATRAALLQGGAVDIAQYLQPLEIVRLRQQPGVKIDSVDASFMIWMELNAKVAPFDNVKVRQAMNFAFPQEQVLKTVFQGLAQPLHGCMPNIYAGYTDKFWKYNYDPAMAKSLLKEAGFPSGFKTSLAYNAGDPVQEPIAILYQTALRQIGVELELKKVPAATFYNAVSERKQPMIFYVDSPWCPDVGYSMTLYFNSQSFIDYSNYKNDEVDKLLRDTARTADQAARLEMMTKAQEIVMSEAPWVFIAFPGYHFAHRANLQGFTYYTANNIRFQDFSRAA